MNLRVYFLLVLLVSLGVVACDAADRPVTPNAKSHAELTTRPAITTLVDYSKTEKTSDLPKRLTKEGAVAGADPLGRRHRLLRAVGEPRGEESQ
jgi:hypothetical protein